MFELEVDGKPYRFVMNRDTGRLQLLDSEGKVMGELSQNQLYRAFRQAEDVSERDLRETAQRAYQRFQQDPNATDTQTANNFWMMLLLMMMMLQQRSGR